MTSACNVNAGAAQVLFVAVALLGEPAPDMRTVGQPARDEQGGRQDRHGHGEQMLDRMRAGRRAEQHVKGQQPRPGQ